MGDFLRRSGWIFLAVVFVFGSVILIILSFTMQSGQEEAITNEETSMNSSAGKQLPNFTPVAEVDSLQKIDQQTGTGKEATPTSTVTVHYTGALAATGKIFESSFDGGQPATFSLDSNLIRGWKEGVPGMKEGGVRRLLIPSELAYGQQANSAIPANSDLVFDITLIKVE